MLKIGVVLTNRVKNHGIPARHFRARLFPRSFLARPEGSGVQIASFPGSCAGEEEREPGTHCSRMRQVPLVTCILLRYTKITVNFCLPPERPHCMVILPVGHIRAILKSKTISL